MAHITYEFYAQNGGTQPEEVFHAMKYQAVSFIRYITYNKATFTTDAEKRAVCGVVDVFANRRTEITSGRNIASESNDGWSVTFATVEGSAEDAVYQSARKVATMHLIGTGLLNRSVGMYD